MWPVGDFHQIHHRQDTTGSNYRPSSAELARRAPPWHALVSGGATLLASYVEIALLLTLPSNSKGELWFRLEPVKNGERRWGSISASDVAVYGRVAIEPFIS